MEPNVNEICKICSSSLNDPRILSCSHSFCLKCLESSPFAMESSKCPICLVKFQMPQGGVANLKKSEFVEHLSKVSVKCDCCKEKQTVKFCVCCSFNYCSTCLEHHKRISSNQHLQPSMASRNVKISINNYSTCKEHLDEMTLFCKNCRVALCDRCLDSTHDGHDVKPVVHHFDSLKNKLHQDIKMKEQILKDVVANYKSSEAVVRDNESKASKLKKKIRRRGEAVKKALDLVEGELNDNVDKILKQHQKNAHCVMKELKSMENDLQVQIETLKKQHKDLNLENMAETSLQDFKFDRAIPGYSDNFGFSLLCDTRDQIFNLRKVVGNIGIDQKSVTKTLEELRTHAKPCVQLFKHVSEALSLRLPTLRDKSLLEIDNLLYAAEDVAAVNALEVASNSSGGPRDCATFFFYHDVFSKVAFSRSTQKRDYLSDTIYLRLLENMDTTNVTGDQEEALTKFVCSLIASRDCSKVCFCLKVVKILVCNHRVFFSNEDNLEDLEFVSSMFWLENLSNMPQAKHQDKKRTSSWMSQQSAAIFKRFKMKSAIIHAKCLRKCVDVLRMTKKLSSHESRMLLISSTDKELVFRFDCLHRYFTSARKEKEKMDCIEAFLGVLIGRLGGDNFSVDFDPAVLGDLQKQLKRLVKHFFASLDCLANDNHCGSEELRNIEKCNDCSTKPYLPGKADFKTAWGSKVRQLVKEKLQDSTSTTETESLEKVDYTIEKFLFFSEFMKKLRVLNIVHGVCFMKKAVLIDVKGTFETFETETFRNGSSPIVKHLNELLRDPTKRGRMPWWVRTTLENCPFLFLPNQMDNIMEDLIKMLKGECIDKETEDKLRRAFENSHSMGTDVVEDDDNDLVDGVMRWFYNRCYQNHLERCLEGYYDDYGDYLGDDYDDYFGDDYEDDDYWGDDYEDCYQ